MGIVLGILAGILMMVIAEKLLHKNLNVANRRLEYMHSFVLLFVAIGIHNLPTGLALGAAMKDESFSLSPLLAALILHHIPEGMALMGSMYW
jgi:ZIP family zinc transporter